MKILLVLAAVLLGVWLWRSNRQKSNPKQRPAAPKTLDMVRCAQCAVHVPSMEAIEGKKGMYCCTEHRQRAEP